MLLLLLQCFHISLYIWACALLQLDHQISIETILKYATNVFQECNPLTSL